MAILSIENAQLWDGRAPGAITNAALQAVDGEITYLGSMAGLPTAAAGEERVDAAGMLLMPGLVNAHTHLAMTLFRGYADDMPLQPWLQEKIWPIEMKLTGEDVYWGSMLGIVEMLRAGVTCFNDMYHHFEDGTRAAQDTGIRALPSGVLLGFIGDPLDNLKKAVEFASRFPKDGLITPMLGPHAPYTCSDDLLAAVAEQALEHDLSVHVHLSETESEVRDSLASTKATPVRHLLDIGLLDARLTAAHCVHLTDEDIAILAETKVGIAHCPGSNMKLGSGFQPLPKLLAAGAIVGLGTDGAASNNNLDLLEEARLAALLHKGYTGDPTVVKADEALRMATSSGAAALGLGDRVGTLEVGKRADCILVNLQGAHNQPLFDVESQMIYAARSSDVDTVIVDGQILLRNSELTRLDEREVIAKAVDCARRLAE